LAIRLLRRPDLRLAALFAAIAAAGHLTRGQAMLVVVGFFLTALFTLRFRDFVRLAAVFVVVHLALVAPWLARMQHVGASAWSVECKMGINLYQYGGAVNPDLYGPDSRFEMPPGIETMTPGQRNSVLMEHALRGIADRPGEYLRRCWSRVFLLFAAAPNFYEVSLAERAIVIAASLIFFHAPLVAVIAGFLRRRRWEPPALFLVTTLCVWYAFHIAVNASIRNRLPTDAFVFALALWVWARPTLAHAPPLVAGSNVCVEES
jgi:hypothetical protein